MNMNSNNISPNQRISQLEYEKKQLLEFIFESNSSVLRYSKYSTINDKGFVSLNVDELIQFLKKPSPTNSNSSINSPINIISQQQQSQHNISTSLGSNGNIKTPSPPTPLQQAQQHVSHSSLPQQSLNSNSNNNLNNSLINSQNNVYLIKSPTNSSTSSNGTASIGEIKLPDNYGFLSKEQFHFSSYETQLLVSHFGRPNDLINLQEEDSFRIQSEISKVKHDGFIRALTPPSQTSKSSPTNSTSKQPLFTSLTYRLWLLKYFNFGLFDTQDSLMIWFKRQLYTVLNGIINLVKDPFDDKENQVVYQLKSLCYNLEVTLQEQSPSSCTDSIYTTPFNNLDKFIGSLFLKSTILNNNSPINNSNNNNHHHHHQNNSNQQLATEYLVKPVPYQFPLNTNMFEDLLFYNLFEFDDDDGIKFIGDEHFRVPPVLKPFAIALKITPTMETICHLNCFLMAYQAEPREEHFKRLHGTLDSIHKLIQTNSTLIQDPTTSSGPLLKMTLKKIASWLVKLLSDVHSYKTSSPSKDIASACSIYIQSREMWSLLSTSKTQIKTTESNFQSFITSSVSCHYQRLSQSYRPMTLENFSEFVELLIPEIKSNLETYTAGFNNVHSKAKVVALNEWVNLYSVDLKLVFADVYFLSPMLLQSVQAASNFQLLLKKLQLIPEENLPPVKTYVSSVIGTWCQNQEKDFTKWFENIFKLDKFTPLDKEVKHSSSVVDMFTMFYQTISTLAKMRGSLSDNFPAFILTLSALFNSNCILAYNSSIENLTLCNQKQILYPTSLNERIQNKSKIRKSISTSSNQLQSSLQINTSKNIPDPNQVAIQSKLSQMSISKLCVCVNNLDHILLNINNYINENSFDNESLRNKLKELFSSTQIVLAETVKKLVDFIGTRVVFYECKQSIIENLYAGPITSKDTISDILESLSPHLKVIYNNSHSIQRGNDILGSVCKAFLQAMEFSILYGGTSRVFQPKDAEFIEYDLELAKDFFLDRDEQGNSTAVSDELFESYVHPLRKLVQLILDLSSDILIEQYNDGKSSFARETILCVLVHRNDKTARSFIKKKLNETPYISIKKGSKISFLVK